MITTGLVLTLGDDATLAARAVAALAAVVAACRRTYGALARGAEAASSEFHHHRGSPPE